MSGHLPIFAFFISEFVSHEKEIKSFQRDYSEQNLIKFRTSLSQVDWMSVVISHDPNESLF